MTKSSNEDFLLAYGVENSDLPVSVKEMNRSPATQAGVPWSHGLDQKKNTGNAPSNPKTSAPTETRRPEAQARCEIPLDRVPVRPGGSYSIWDVMTRQSTFGTFTGNLDLDREYLAPWFGGALMGYGSSLWEAAKSSKAFSRAFQFLNGNHIGYQGQYFKWQDYYYGAKMAGILTSMMATIGDRECTIAIRRQADRILPPEVAAELDELPFLQAAELAASGRLASEFSEIDGNRKKLYEEREKVERGMLSKERAGERETHRIQAELKSVYHELKKQMMEVPDCRGVVVYQELMIAGKSEKAHLDSLVSECRAAIDDRLDRLRRQEAELLLKSTRFVEGDEKNSQTEPGPQEKALNEELNALQESTRTYERYLGWLNGVDAAPVTARLDNMYQLLDRRQEIQNSEFLKSYRQQINEIDQQLDSLSNKWLTYGFSGGFEFTPSWMQKYRSAVQL